MQQKSRPIPQHRCCTIVRSIASVQQRALCIVLLVGRLSSCLSWNPRPTLTPTIRLSAVEHQITGRTNTRRNHDDDSLISYKGWERIIYPSDRADAFQQRMVSSVTVDSSETLRDGEDEPEDEDTTSLLVDSPVKLSRSDRKALERAKKQAPKRVQRAPLTLFPAGSVSSRSTSQDLPVSSTGERTHITLETLLSTIKRAQFSRHQADLLAVQRYLNDQPASEVSYTTTETNLTSVSLSTVWARLAVAAVSLYQFDLAKEAWHERQLSQQNDQGDAQHGPHSDRFAEAAALVRAYVRRDNLTMAWQIVNDELGLPSSSVSSPRDVSTPNFDAIVERQNEQYREQLHHRALCLVSLASKYFVSGEPYAAALACRLLAETGSIAQTYATRRSHSATDGNFAMPWERLLLAAVSCQSRIRNQTLDTTILPKESMTFPNEALASDNMSTTQPLPCNVVYAVLAAMSCFPPENSDRVYELVATALVRRVLFVTGAVSMEGCPAPDRGEACFIGRSNVGKSSLINMITSRKALAYTSKRPGKTQQFNFFAVNDVPGKEKEIKYGDFVPGQRDPDSFYIVDLPGFGYAKVPEHQRNTWLTFMHEYLAHRASLRVVFHLIDSRHGPTEDDAIIMTQVGKTIQNEKSTTRSMRYVVVLTKSDKNVKGGGTADEKKRQGRTGQVSDTVMVAVRDTMRTCGVAHAPVILSSAETKLGRDDLWRYLRLAAETT